MTEPTTGISGAGRQKRLYDGVLMPNQLEDPKQDDASSLSTRLYYWLIFVGLVAVVSPLVAAFVSFANGESPTLQALLSEGDGFLIAVAVTADAIGRAMQQKQSSRIFTVACGLVLMAALLGFGVTKTELVVHKSKLDDSIASLSQSTPGDGLKSLLAVLKEPAIKNEHGIEHFSLILIGAGLLTSFMIVRREER